MWLLLPLLTLALILGIVVGLVGGSAVSSMSLIAWSIAAAIALGAARRDVGGALVLGVAFLCGCVVAARPASQPFVPLGETLHCAIQVERTSLRDDGWSITGQLLASRGGWESRWTNHEPVRVVIHRAAGAWAPTFGDVISVRAELSPPRSALHEFAFDPLAHATLRDIQASGAAESELVLLSLGRGVRPAIDRLRVRLERSIVTRAQPREAGVLLAILTGDKSRLDPDLREAFAANGAAHVLAVSGLHLGLICLFLFQSLRRVFRRSALICTWIGSDRASALLTLPATIGYVLLTGCPASAVRAGVMATIVLVGVILNRRPSGFHALCAAAFVMLVANPLWLLDVGFQLSVTATGSLILTPKRPTNTVRSWLIEGLRISTVASLATTPVLLWHFGVTPLMSPLTNLVVVPPVAFVALPFGLLGAMCDVLGLPGGNWLIWVAALAVRISAACAEWGAPVLEWSVTWGRPDLLGLVGWSALALASPGFGVASRKSHLVCVLVVSLLCVTDIPRRSSDLVVHAIPVGQGDCTLVESQHGRILVDAPGGPRTEGVTSRRAIIPYLVGRGIRRVDVVVITHADLDHAGDAATMIRWARPSEVWLPAGQDSRAISRARRAASDVGATIRSLRLPLARMTGETSLVVLPAPPNLDRNNGGLVLRFCRNAVCALLAGDIEAPREAMLLQASGVLSAEYLKVPHHGSSTSSTAEFLDVVRPRIAVTHVGAGNRFGFPHDEVSARYRERAIRFRRTDLGRAVLWQTDGQRWWEPSAYRFKSR